MNYARLKCFNYLAPGTPVVALPFTISFATQKSESVPSLMSLPVEWGGVCEAKYVLMTRPDLIVFQLPLEPSTHRPGN